jgi:hypothetical protein
MRRFTAHHANSDGPFKPVDGVCGAPESEAEGMMAHDGSGHCFFRTQPGNDSKTARLIDERMETNDVCAVATKLAAG